MGVALPENSFSHEAVDEEAQRYALGQLASLHLVEAEPPVEPVVGKDGFVEIDVDWPQEVVDRALALSHHVRTYRSRPQMH